MTIEVGKSSSTLPIGSVKYMSPKLPLDISVDGARWLQSGITEKDSNNFDVNFWSSFKDYKEVATKLTIPSYKSLDEGLRFEGGIYSGNTTEGYLIYSTDGKNFISNETARLAVRASPSVYDGVSRWCACGTMTSSTNGVIYTSTDGINYSSVYIVSQDVLSSIHYANGRWLIVGYNATASRFITLTSTNGTSWTKKQHNGVISDGNKLTFANNTWVCLGDNNSVVTSLDDGNSWSLIPLPNTIGFVRGIKYFNGLWHCLTQDNTGSFMHTSLDGLSWSDPNLVSIYGFSGLEVIGGNLFAFGSSSVLLKTSNGVDFTVETIESAGVFNRRSMLPEIDAEYSMWGDATKVIGSFAEKEAGIPEIQFRNESVAYCRIT